MGPVLMITQCQVGKLDSDAESTEDPDEALLAVGAMTDIKSMLRASGCMAMERNACHAWLSQLSLCRKASVRRPISE